jgi:DNA-binding NtrC family response regulator
MLETLDTAGDPAGRTEPGISTKVLLVEDEPLLAEAHMAFLDDLDCAFTLAETGAQALEAIAADEPDVILLDLVLPDMNGLEIVRHVKAAELPAAVIVITSQASVNVAVEAMRAGAADFLVKPTSADRLVFTFRNVLERQRLKHTVETYEKTFAREQYCGFIGLSPGMQAVYSIIDSAAASKATVFITGESGTGKELGAEAIHRQSPRRDRPMVTVNCAAIPRDLLESEIFGHVRGAFTGAISDRNGAASRADGGTLFFDEICEMDLALQAKLLRFVQTGSFQKVGGNRTEEVDVRFVCATNRSPLEEVRARRFREDLYYRLHVIPIELPPLRERGNDILLIARHFLADLAREEGKQFTSFSSQAAEILQTYAWPGNVRQLLNVLRNVVVLNDGEVVSPSMLPELQNAVRAAQPDRTREIGAAAANGGGILSENGIRPLWLVEKQAIEEAVELCGGNVLQAAARLGISDSTIYRKRRAWGRTELTY